MEKNYTELLVVPTDGKPDYASRLRAAISEVMEVIDPDEKPALLSHLLVIAQFNGTISSLEAHRHQWRAGMVIFQGLDKAQVAAVKERFKEWPQKHKFTEITAGVHGLALDMKPERGHIPRRDVLEELAAMEIELAGKVLSVSFT